MKRVFLRTWIKMFVKKLFLFIGIVKIIFYICCSNYERDKFRYGTIHLFDTQWVVVFGEEVSVCKCFAFAVWCWGLHIESCLLRCLNNETSRLWTIIYPFHLSIREINPIILFLHGSRVTQSSWLWAVVLSVYADRGSGKNSRGGDE